MLDIFAHGNAVEHAQESIPLVNEQSILDKIAAIDWYIQLPLFVLFIAIIGAVVWLVTKKIDTVAFVVSFIMLIASFFLYEVAPVVSATAITAGLVLTLLITLAGLGSTKKS